MRATIKLKLAATFAIITVLTAIMAWLGGSNLGSLDASMTPMIQGPMRLNEIVSDMQIDLLQLLRAEKNMIMSDTQEAIARYDAELLQQRAQFLEHMEKYQSGASARGKEILSTMHTP